ncbi:MAG: hypothetical protein ACK5PP_10295 [Acidimicrobiales bacterium]
MIVAELEIFHSRPIAPTRRVALGRRNLPVDPAPGAGGVLLAGIVAHNAPGVEADLREGLVRVLETLAAGGRVVQPTVRHRFQTDRVGLLVSRQQLVAVDGTLGFEFTDGLARPVQLALGALYAAGSLTGEGRAEIFNALRSALVWGRPVDQEFITAVMNGRVIDLADHLVWDDPVAWAKDILGIEDEGEPSKRLVQRRFRTLLRDAHPDHGGVSAEAAARIEALSEARRILLP